MVAATLNKALHELEELLAKCEKGGNSRELSDLVACIMERIEAAHSASLEIASSHKRISELLKLESQRADALQHQLDIAARKDNHSTGAWIGPSTEY